MLAFVVLGIIQGAIIGMLAIGIVLVYKGARVFNFAQGEFGTLAAFFLLWLNEARNIPYMFALALALVGVAGVGFVMERVVVRPLFDAPRVTLLVATAGVALLSIGLELLLGGTELKQVGAIIPGRALVLFGATISWQQVISLLVFGLLAVGLAYFFNKTDLGLAVLATSQEPVATELVGIGTKKMSSFIWVFAAVLGGIAGLLQAPDTTFGAGFMTSNYLLAGFTASVVGGITSLAGAFVGGLMIGLISQVGAYFYSRFVEPAIEPNQIPAFPELLVFILLVTILVVRPKGLLGKEA